VPTAWPAWHVVAFLQLDFGGRPLFVHRCRDKFRWGGQIDGADVPGWFMTRQWHPETQYVEGLPHEQLAHDFCRESSELLRPELHFACRPNTCDRGIFIENNLQNEYRLPPRFEPGDVIVDVGGHIGAFAYACLSRGAGRVITCEPEPSNVELLRQNLARWGDRVEIIPAAVWPAGIPAPNLSPPPDPANTCQYSMVFREGGSPVPTITLEEVIVRAGGRVRLLKLDCEGAEYPILRHSRLDGVREICGEAHDVEHEGQRLGIADVLAVLPGATHFKNGPATSLWLWRA